MGIGSCLLLPHNLPYPDWYPHLATKSSSLLVHMWSFRQKLRVELLDISEVLLICTWPFLEREVFCSHRFLPCCKSFLTFKSRCILGISLSTVDKQVPRIFSLEATECVWWVCDAPTKTLWSFTHSRWWEATDPCQAYSRLIENGRY